MKYNYNKIFKRLIDLKMTGKELAAGAGISVSTLTRMKHGSAVSIDILQRIAEVLDCGTEELYELEKETDFQKKR
ncbi:MAG: helix-turn-helix transcriptional regulator [Lachnospiraceae bacterium]|nr:helix-turn-helix transcriptional regulator [Lachnospiraceae bacterium]